MEGPQILFAKVEGLCTGTAVNGPIVGCCAGELKKLENNCEVALLGSGPPSKELEVVVTGLPIAPGSSSQLTFQSRHSSGDCA